MVTVLLGLNFLLMIVLPIILARKIAEGRRAGWGLFGIGAVTFVLSQVGHIPFNWVILQQSGWFDGSSLLVLSIFLGLSAGTFEGVARYLTFRFWAKGARSWRQGLMVGMGHGGIEAIIIGVLGSINFVILLGISEGYFQEIVASVPVDQLPQLDQQIAAMFNVPAPQALYGAVERVFAMMLHLSASLLVLQAFTRRQLRWLAAGILWHAVVDGSLYYVFRTWGIVWSELALGILSFVSLGIIFGLRVPEPVEAEPPPLPELRPLTPIEVSGESLERSKYS